MAQEWKGTMQEYGKLNFDFVLMTFVTDINKQLAKLPHESVMANINEAVGTTHDDVITSYCDMVEQLERLLECYWDETYTGETFEGETRWEKSKKRFGSLMRLCNRRNFLFTKTKTKVSGEDSG